MLEKLNSNGKREREPVSPKPKSCPQSPPKVLIRNKFLKAPRGIEKFKFNLMKFYNKMTTESFQELSYPPLNISNDESISELERELRKLEDMFPELSVEVKKACKL